MLSQICMVNDINLEENWTNLPENLKKISSEELIELAFCNSVHCTVFNCIALHYTQLCTTRGEVVSCMWDLLYMA